MATGNLGTNTTSSLQGVRFNAMGATTTGNVLSAADLASISQSIVGDRYSAGPSWTGASGPAGVLATGTTHSNTTLDTLVSTGGAPLASIQIGALVLGINIVPGTFVIAKPTSTSVTLSVAATDGVASKRILFVNPGIARQGTFSFEGLIEIPGRGRLVVRPNDVVAVDNTGWPILVSGASLAYAGTQWTRTSIT